MDNFSFEELQRRRIANLQAQFTNAEELQKGEDSEMEKARHGVYADTAQNRRLNRVGQEYGYKAEEKQPSGQRTKKTDEASGGGGKTVADHAADTDSKVLQKVVDDPDAKPELKEAAQAELKKRGEGGKEENSGEQKVKKNKREFITKNGKKVYLDDKREELNKLNFQYSGKKINLGDYLDDVGIKFLIKADPKYDENKDALIFNFAVNGERNEALFRIFEAFQEEQGWNDIGIEEDGSVHFRFPRRYTKEAYEKSDEEIERQRKEAKEFVDRLKDKLQFKFYSKDSYDYYNYKESLKTEEQKKVEDEKEKRAEEKRKQQEEKEQKQREKYKDIFEKINSDEETSELPGIIDGLGYHIADYDIDIKELEDEGYTEGDKIWDQIMKEKLLNEMSKYNDKIVSAVNKYGLQAVKSYIKQESETIKNSELNAIINQALESSKNK